MRSLCLWKTAVLSAFALVGAERAAMAGPVTSGSGQVVLDLNTPIPGPASATFPFTFPEDGAVSATATLPGFAESARVQYDLVERPDGATITARPFNDSPDPPVSFGGSSRFELTFTTDRALLFRYEAGVTPPGPSSFEARFDGILATAAITPVTGELTGTIPIVRDPEGNAIEFGVLTRQGLLPAGTYTFTADARSGLDRNTAVQADGFAELTLNPIPLPPGAWAGLVALAGLVLRQTLRRGPVGHG